MKNEASKTRTLDIAFLVDAQLLRRLAVILSETAETLEFTVKFSDGTSVQYSDVEEVIGQPNSRQRSIVSLIVGTLGETAKSAFVNLKKDGSPSLEYTVYGTQRDVIYFANHLDDWVSAVRLWYSPFFASEKGFSVAAAGLLLAAFLLPVYAWDYISKLSGALGKSGSSEWIALPMLIAMWIAEYYILKFFPRGTFAIGHGERRHQFFIYVQRTVLFGSLLSVLLRVLWVLFTRQCD